MLIKLGHLRLNTDTIAQYQARFYVSGVYSSPGHENIYSEGTELTLKDGRTQIVHLRVAEVDELLLGRT